MDKRKGFTLLELLVVIAIIGLLMAILMPALGKAKKQALKVACQATLHQWSFPFTMYCDDNDGLFSGGREIQGVFWEHEWVYRLRPYYKTSEACLCPAATKTWMDDAPGTFVGWDWRAAEQWLADDIYWYYEGTYGSYGKNSWCSQWNHGYDPTGGSWNWRGIRIKGGNRVPLFLDCIFVGGFPVPEDPPPEYEGQTFWSGGGGEMNRYVIPRHNEYVNSLFLDLSVREVGLKELWKLKWHREFDIDGPWTIAGWEGNVAKLAERFDEEAPWMRNFPEY